MSTVASPRSPASACRSILGTLIATSVFLQATIGTVELAHASAHAAKPAATGAATSPAAGATPEKAASLQQIERDFKAAGARYSASDYLGAIAGFVQCLTVYEMNGHTEASIRGAVLFNLGKAYEKAFETERETRYLRLARDTYVRYLNESAQGANYGDNDYVKLRLADVERELAQLPDANQPASAATGHLSEPATNNGSPASTSHEQSGDLAPVVAANSAKKTVDPERLRRSAHRKRRLGIGLMAGGGGGLALGSTLVTLAVLEVQDDTSVDETWDEDVSAAASLLYSGTFFVVAGVGMLVTGGILYGKGKRDLRRVEAMPVKQVSVWGMPTRGGLAAGLSGRF